MSHHLSTDSGVEFNFNSDFSGDVTMTIPGMSVIIDVPGSALVEFAALVATSRVEEWVRNDLYNVIITKKVTP